MKKQKLLGDIGKVLIIAYVITIVMLLILSLLLYKLGLSTGQIKIGIIITYVLAAGLSGFIMAKVQKTKRVVWGFIMGLLYFVILFVVSFFMNKGINAETSNVLLTGVICMVSGAMGGILS